MGHRVSQRRKNIEENQGMGEERLQTTDNSRLRWARKVDQLPWKRFAWAWSALIVLICLMPFNPGAPSTLPLDKLAHFLLFAGFGALWLRVYPQRMVRIAIIGTIFGLAIEILQSTLNWGRMGDGADLAADCIGLFLALGIGARLSHSHRRGQG